MIRKTRQLSDLNLRVSWLEAGRGAPLVLVHGVGMNAEAWFPQLEALSETFRVIAVDMPGHGESEGFPHAATLNDYVRWLAAFLPTLEEKSFAVAGHSMGALITAGLAIEYPALVNHAVVISGVYKRSAEASKAVITRARELMLGDVRTEAPLDRWFSEDTHSPLRQRVGEWLKQVDRMGYARAYQAFATGDRIYADRWREMRCPVLVMTGELDANSSPAMAHRMAEAAPNGVAVVVGNARHMLNLTDAERVNDEIVTFLSSVSAEQTVKE